jgi:hypothetical protein
MADCTTQHNLKEAHMQLMAGVSHHWTPHSRTNFDKTCQPTDTVRGSARRPRFSLAIISVTDQLWTYVFWVISAYFNIRNTLLKSGTFLLGHPVRIYINMEHIVWDIVMRISSVEDFYNGHKSCDLDQCAQKS